MLQRLVRQVCNGLFGLLSSSSNVRLCIKDFYCWPNLIQKVTFPNVQPQRTGVMQNRATLLQATWFRLGKAAEQYQTASEILQLPKTYLLKSQENCGDAEESCNLTRENMNSVFVVPILLFHLLGVHSTTHSFPKIYILIWFYGTVGSSWNT